MREGHWGEKRERFEAEIRRVFFHIRLEENRLEVRLRSLRTTTLYSIASTYILFLVVQETEFPIFLRKTQHEHQNVNDESYFIYPGIFFQHGKYLKTINFMGEKFRSGIIL